ncbi:MAG: hypothetical protein M0R80_05310 [Proteobacteria bacterium]|jgi:hypothetical protein|nr:hypothetical protein [Pseudomonadota bacterium]
MKKLAGVLVVLSLALALGACQSYEKGVEVICQGPNSCAECANIDPSMRMAMMAKSIDDNLSNGKATDLFGAMAAMSPAERVAKLEAEAKAAGLASCPLVDELREAAAAE